MDLSHGVFQLKGVVQNYSWGGFEYIPRLLNITNDTGKPFAEYWLGAHPNFPAHVLEDNTLDRFVAANPSAILGEQVANKFASLPYLLKVLDVRQMLSIQVHPEKSTAKIEFEKENTRGIPLTAPNRNYKDANHKPELMVAQGEFWLLHGFKDEKKLADILEETNELHFLKKIFSEQGYKGLYETVMLMPQQEINQHLHPLVQRIMPAFGRNELNKSQEDFWVARAVATFCREDQYDRGIFSIYFFNLVLLKKGEGVFQPEGLPHAYLEGQNVEVMANSDNVLRAGLTDKHIDVKELLRHVKFQPTIPRILAASGKHTLYETPAEEFELHHYQLAKSEEITLQTKSAEIFFLMEGSLLIKSGDRETKLKTGSSVLVSTGMEVKLNPLSEVSIFRVTVPTAKN